MNKFIKKMWWGLLVPVMFSFTVCYAVGFMMLFDIKSHIQSCKNIALNSNKKHKTALFNEYLQLFAIIFSLTAFNCLAIFVTIKKGMLL